MEMNQDENLNHVLLLIGFLLNASTRTYNTLLFLLVHTVHTCSFLHFDKRVSCILASIII